jgi:rod shape-determining protein MreC
MLTYQPLFYKPGICYNISQTVKERGCDMSFWRNRPLIVTIITTIILLVLLILTAGKNNMSGTESIAGSILSPVQSALYSATDAVSDFFSRVFSGSDLQTENTQLKARVAELEGQLQDYKNIKAENERLASLLNFDAATEDLDKVTARVIFKDYGLWFNTMVLNVGMANGIEVDMPVVNGDGLVGRVVDVGAKWCRVMTIVDSMSGVSAIVERTRDNGILTGTVSTGEESEAVLNMSYLPLDADLVPGDTAITSGLEGIFPKGIPIGKVTEVSPGSSGMDNEAVVTPWVDFAHIEEVMIITTKPVDISEALG